MRAYVVKDRSGTVRKGWLLRQGTSIDSSMCRLPHSAAAENVEEVSVETAVRGAAQPCGSSPAGRSQTR